MKREIPPLDAIEAFLKATEAASFRAAADALAISPPAFSRRIQALEAFLGTRLFDRSGPRPALNAAGRSYLKAIAPAIDALRGASVRSADRAGPLRIMAPHSFALSWLAPRLPEFMAQGGQRMPVELVISRDLAALQMGNADIAIVSGPRDWGDLSVEPLAELTGVLVSAPRLFDGRPAPTGLAELARYPLLGVSSPSDLWQTWLKGVGYGGLAVRAPVLYDTASLLYEAAAAGLGLAIATPFLSERLLASGQLRRVGHERAPLNVGYHLVCASAAVRRRPGVRAFCTWAHAAADATLAAFDHSP